MVLYQLGMNKVKKLGRININAFHLKSDQEILFSDHSF